MNCPRWRLINAHYLTIPYLPDGTKVEWEHKENSKATGRTVRKLFAVPLLVDPNDPADHNHPGEIIVSHDVDGAHHDRRDLIFIGDPTPDMECLNPEAEEITAAIRHKWEHPIDTLPVNGGMSQHEQAFMKTLMEQFAQQVGATAPQGNATVSREDYDNMKERVAKLEALILAQNKAPPTVERRA